MTSDSNVFPVTLSSRVKKEDSPERRLPRRSGFSFRLENVSLGVPECA
jgi:hypothetical protein